jgi:hypothetical protein
MGGVYDENKPQERGKGPYFSALGAGNWAYLGRGQSDFPLPAQHCKAGQMEIGPARRRSNQLLPSRSNTSRMRWLLLASIARPL